VPLIVLNGLKVNVFNTDPASWDPQSGEGAGVATFMTGIGHVMAKAGYTTAVVGKWDVGMATQKHTPAGW
jgi:arylsulfatase A-like enzyme